MSAGKFVAVAVLGVGAYVIVRKMSEQANPFSATSPFNLMDPARTAAISAAQQSVRTAGPGNVPYNQQRQPDPPLALYEDIGGNTGSVLTQTGTSTGLALTGAALAPGALTAGAMAIPIVGAGVALLSWAVVQKGLFRGGEEALHVNPTRDQYLLQFGPPGWNYDEPMSGAPKLAKILAEISAYEQNYVDNQKYAYLMDRLLQADQMNEFVPTAREIRDLLARYGLMISAP